MKTKKIFALLLALSMALCALAGCSGDDGGSSASDVGAASAQPSASPSDTAQTASPEPSEQAAEPVTLNVAYMPNYAALWAVTTANEKGYFAEENITVKLQEFADGPTEITAMESGSIDVSYIGPGAHKLCSTGNASVFLIQQLGDADCVIGLKSHGVEKLEDLAGKTVAYASGTSSETILNLALSSVGLTMDDIDAYDMDTSNMVNAVLSGSVDACATWSPNSLTILAEAGDDAVKFCSNTDFLDQTVTPASWVCTPAYAEENRDVLVRFVRAMYKAMDYGSQEEHFEEVAGYVAAQYGTDQQTAYDQRGDGDWMSKADVVDAIESGEMIDWYTLQQQNFIDAGNVDAATALPVEDFVLTGIMLDAAE